jgi:hypothetical protein
VTRWSARGGGSGPADRRKQQRFATTAAHEPRLRADLRKPRRRGGENSAPGAPFVATVFARGDRGGGSVGIVERSAWDTKVRGCVTTTMRRVPEDAARALPHVRTMSTLAALFYIPSSDSRSAVVQRGASWEFLIRWKTGHTRRIMISEAAAHELVESARLSGPGRLPGSGPDNFETWRGSDQASSTVNRVSFPVVNSDNDAEVENVS